jgi:hypothetical protein
LLQEEGVVREFRPTRAALGVLVPQVTTDKIGAERPSNLQAAQDQEVATVEVGVLFQQVQVGVVLQEMVRQCFLPLLLVRTIPLEEGVLAT